jgi:hypothetical protein
MNSKHNTSEEQLHQYSMLGSVQLETTQKKCNPKHAMGEKASKETQNRQAQLTGTIKHWQHNGMRIPQFSSIQFNFQQGHLNSCYHHNQKAKHLPKKQSQVPSNVGKLLNTTVSNIKTKIKVCKVFVQLLLLYNFIKYICPFLYFNLSLLCNILNSENILCEDLSPRIILSPIISTLLFFRFYSVSLTIFFRMETFLDAF